MLTTQSGEISNNALNYNFQIFHITIVLQWQQQTNETSN